MADYVILIEGLHPPWRCFEGEQWKCELTDFAVSHCNVQVVTWFLFVLDSVNKSNIENYNVILNLSWWQPFDLL